MPTIGSPAPDFTLLDTDKQKHSIGDYQGKKTVLVFYPGAFTGVCTKELCTFRDFLAEFNSMNAAVLGISVDSIFANKAFKEANNLAFPLLSDITRTVVQKYGVEIQNFAGIEGYFAAQRSVFVLDPKGNIVYQWIAENPGIEPNYAEVRDVLSRM